MVCSTVSEVGLITLSVAEPLLATQTRPSGATARLRGELPTGISACLVKLLRRKTETLSLSILAVQKRGG
jgi:hypothetical protein